MKAWRNLIKSYDNVKQSSVNKEKNVDGLGICVVPATSIGIYIKKTIIPKSIANFNDEVAFQSFN